MITLPHHSLDVAIVLFFNKFCGKSQFWDTLALLFLSVDALRTAILVALTVGIWQYGKSKSDISAQKRVLYVLFSIILTLGIIEILNALIDSSRPIVTLGNLIYNPITTSDTQLLWKEGWVRNPKHGSFPSDTIALLTTIACGLFFWNRILGSVAFLFVLIAGILPRLYFGLHYPSYMVFGVIVAILSSIIIEQISFFKFLREKLFSISKRFPYLFGVIGFYLAYIIAEKFILLRKLPVWIKVMLGH
jgi:membrane-associated phospholipid phosphatase